MKFSISGEANASWLLINGDQFFPCSQEDIRHLWSRWLYPFHVVIARDMIEYLALRMDQIKRGWLEADLEISEWPKQDEAQEYRKLERNWTLLNTLYNGGKRYV